MSDPARPIAVAESPEDARDPVDRELLDQLVEACGGREAARSLVEQHVVNAGLQLDRMKAALAANDRETLHRIAHSLKSSSAMFGLHRVSDLCQAIEHLTHHAVPPGAADALGALEEVHARDYPVLARLAETTLRAPEGGRVG